MFPLIHECMLGQECPCGCGLKYSLSDFTLTEMVRDFHAKFDHPVAETPTTLETHAARLRMSLIYEEVDELHKAMWHKDIVGVADALADIAYVVWGTAISMGIPLEEVIDEVHDANMRKLWPDGEPRYREDGKVLKPDDWEPPDIWGILEAHS